MISKGPFDKGKKQYKHRNGQENQQNCVMVLIDAFSVLLALSSGKIINGQD